MTMMKALFQAADKNKDNKLSLPEFCAVANEEFGLNAGEADRVFRGLDRTASNNLSLSEFLSFAKIQLRQSARTDVDPTTSLTRPRLSREVSATRLPPRSEALMAKCVVKIWTAKSRQSYAKPWSVFPTQYSTGTGFVVDSKRKFIITNAHVVVDHTCIHVRLYGSHERVEARVLFVSEECDLCLLTVDEPEFWTNVEFQAEFTEEVPRQFEPTIVIGYPLGGDTISMTKGVISRVDCRKYNSKSLYVTRLLVIQIDAAINHGNSGGPVFSKEGKVIGVAFSGISASRADGIGYIIPVPVVRSFLKAYDASPTGVYGGVCTAGFNTQGTESKALRASLSLDKVKSQEVVRRGEDGVERREALDGGILVNFIYPGGCAYDKLQRDDVILAIDGHALGFDGTYRFRGNDRLSYQHLLTSKVIGEKTRFTILRHGDVVDVTVNAAPTKPTIPQFHGRDATPDYFICGGFTFIRLSMPYLQQRRNPSGNHVKALHQRQRTGRADGDIIVVSAVLPHDANFGYSKPSVPLTSLNGVHVKTLRDLVREVEKAFEDPTGYFEFEFGNDAEMTKVILDVKRCKDMRDEIIKRYQIPSLLSKNLQQVSRSRHEKVTKTLSFSNDFVEWILSGKKRATTRVDKFPFEDGTCETAGELCDGDVVRALNDDEHAFATLKITRVEKRTYGSMDDELARLENLDSGETLKKVLLRFYPKLSDDSPLLVLYFDVLKRL